MDRNNTNRRGRALNSVTVRALWIALVGTACATEPVTDIPRRLVQGDGLDVTYAFEQLALLHYGSADGEIGYVEGPEMAPSGPESFWVDDDGHVFICDSINQRIQQLSPAGRVLGHRDIGFSGNDLAVDRNGEMFVLDRSRRLVEQIGARGERRGAIPLSQRHVDTAFNLRVVNDQVRLASVMQDEAVLGRMQSGTMALLGKPEAPASIPGLSGRSQQRFATIRSPHRSADIDVYTDRAETVDKLRLPVEDVASVVFLGEDDAGNSYFQVETSEGHSGVNLSVYGLDTRGDLSSMITNLPNDYYVWTAKLLQVDRHGDIYQMLPTSTAVEINVWRRR